MHCFSLLFLLSDQSAGSHFPFSFWLISFCLFVKYSFSCSKRVKARCQLLFSVKKHNWLQTLTRRHRVFSFVFIKRAHQVTAVWIFLSNVSISWRSLEGNSSDAVTIEIKSNDSEIMPVIYVLCLRSLRGCRIIICESELRKSLFLNHMVLTQTSF